MYLRSLQGTSRYFGLLLGTSSYFLVPLGALRQVYLILVMYFLNKHIPPKYQQGIWRSIKINKLLQRLLRILHNKHPYPWVTNFFTKSRRRLKWISLRHVCFSRGCAPQGTFAKAIHKVVYRSEAVFLKMFDMQIIKHVGLIQFMRAVFTFT